MFAVKGTDMFTKIFDALKTGIAELDESGRMYVERYKGEFEEGADWNPRFPCALIRFMGMYKFVEGKDSNILLRNSKVMVYCAVINKSEPAILDLIETLMEYFNNTTLQIDITPDPTDEETDPEKVYTYATLDLEDDNCNFHGYYKGVEVYTINAKITHI